MSEKDSLERNPRVSRKALEALHGDLYGWALSRAGYEAATAEDLVQQAYVEVLSGRARFDDKSSLKTFMIGVVQNLARSRFRKIAVRLRLVRTYGDSTEPVAPPAEPDDGRNSAVWQAVGSLPARQRDITELVFCRDLTVDEASKVMGVTVGTGRVHYDRAKKALAAKLASLEQKESEP